eukprot:scaffold178848_cov32-Tisochrysis_lutea.AAC.4
MRWRAPFEAPPSTRASVQASLAVPSIAPAQKMRKGYRVSRKMRKRACLASARQSAHCQLPSAGPPVAVVAAAAGSGVAPLWPAHRRDSQ